MSHMKRERTRSWAGLNRTTVGNAAPHSPSSQNFFQGDDGEAISSSPIGTPPKKVWEQKYRSFLGGQNKSRGGSSGDSLDCKTMIPPRKSPSSGQVNAVRLGKPDVVRSSSRRGISAPNMFQRDPVNTSGEDSSVRGGKLFSGIFRRDKEQHNDDSISSRGSKRSTSTDELDGTLRRGMEKSYSPSSPKHTVIHPNAVNAENYRVPLRSGGAVPAYIPPLRQTSAPSLDARPPPLTTAPRIRSAHSLSPSSVQIDESSAFHLPTDPSSDKSSTKPQELSDDDLPEGLQTLPIPLPNISVPSGHRRTGSGLSVTEEPSDDEPITSDLEIASMKKKFFELHNEHSSESPFLGEEGSNHLKTAAFWTSTRGKLPTYSSLGALAPILDKQASLDPVPENIEITKERMLRPFVGVEEWKSGRRYLIGPAAFAACPIDTSRSIVFSNHPSSGAPTFLSATQAQSAGPVARSVVLGNCLLSYALAGNRSSTTAKTWSRASLILFQNYLLEFDEDFITATRTASTQEFKGQPRGYAHLQGATARPHCDFADAVELDFYGSPCAKSDFRSLVIRLANRSERDTWVACFNQAGSMQLSDLYDMDTSLPLLGEGSYSTVHQARLRDGSTSQPVALKVFDKAAFWKLVVKGRERADTIVRETSVQATLTSKRLEENSFLRLRGFFETSQHVVLELELLDGLDLFHYISSKGVVAESEAAKILSDILNCLIAMNAIGVAHRDIKPANVLMCQDGESDKDKARVKVCDFGMSTFVGVDGQVRGRCGTPGYVAPEIFTTGLHGGYGNKIDVYSAGVTLYVMLCGYEPFYGETDEELVAANKNSEVEFPREEWKTVSKEARNLVEMLMDKDASRRPSAKEALLHPWFKKHLGSAYGKMASSTASGIDMLDVNCLVM